MRKQVLFNDGWIFTKAPLDPSKAADATGQPVCLPHTWNAKDGQDGGNDYYRGRCSYIKHFEAPTLEPGQEAWLEFRGANSSAEVWLNGRQLCRHDGGYSTFRTQLTPALQAQNTLVVAVDNSRNRTVYPQKADFTFYGGIYRDVWLIIVPGEHFALDFHGGPGFQVQAEMTGGTARVTMRAWATGGSSVRFSIDGGPAAEAPLENGCAEVVLTLESPRLWDGLDDPQLYTARAALLCAGQPVDTADTRFGCRSFSFDKDQGFFLNGRSYPLRGVSRHQDRQGVGNAINRQMMQEDIGLILEMGANTVRLAHYQHDQYFYDLCDEAGLVVWAEIPYISEHMPEANANTQSQLTELIVQCANHPSIVCWGLSNEITAVGGCSEDILENHRRLNELAHRLDPTRPTCMAHAFMLEVESPLLEVPDVQSYNLYFGWYLGELSGNDEWFADFRAKNPDKVIGLSEYGADANPQFQTANPERGDYTEQYQAVYHEHMLGLFEKSPYMWATHVWNMFDFAADGRDEGGKHGVNQKGLVTFDRKLKKDAFYAYKACWAKEPFVHLCGSRFVDRPEDMTQVKVYSNCDRVALYCDGALVAEQAGSHVFVFELAISGEHRIEAKSGACTDSMRLRSAAQPNPDYAMAAGAVINWFDQEEFEFPEGYYSIKDTMLEIKANPAGAVLIETLMSQAKAKRGDVAQGVKMPEAMQRMMDAMTVEKMLKQAGDAIAPEQVLQLNQALNRIPKP